jgi:hypothetical protein
MIAPSPESPTEYEAISAYDLAERLFDPELTELQRQDLWEQYQGKNVKWISEVRKIEPIADDVKVEFFCGVVWYDVKIKAIFDGTQKPNLLKLEAGDLIVYKGILDSFRKSGELEINLRDCTFVSLAITLLWQAAPPSPLICEETRLLVDDKALYLGPGERVYLGLIVALDRQTGELLWSFQSMGMLGAIDAHYVYAWNVIERGAYWRGAETEYHFELEIYALDKVSGKVSGFWSRKFQIVWPALDEFVEESIRQRLRNETVAKAGSEVIFMSDKPGMSELSYDYEGITYNTGSLQNGHRYLLRAIDSKKDSVLWLATFATLKGNGVSDFVVADGILYVLINYGPPPLVAAYKLR